MSVKPHSLAKATAKAAMPGGIERARSAGPSRAGVRVRCIPSAKGAVRSFAQLRTVRSADERHALVVGARIPSKILVEASEALDVPATEGDRRARPARGGLLPVALARAGNRSHPRRTSRSCGSPSSPSSRQGLFGLRSLGKSQAANLKDRAVDLPRDPRTVAKRGTKHNEALRFLGPAAALASDQSWVKHWRALLA